MGGDSGNIESGSGNKITLSVPAYEAVIVMREDDNTADAPVIGEDETETEPITEEPAPETTVETDPITEAPTDVVSCGGDQEQGCASALSVSAAVLATACAAVVVLKKKKEHN